MNTLEQMERLVATVVATNSAGQGLPLIGGFRFRLLNDSPRMSADLDYHWEGDLEEKQSAISSLLEREFLPQANQKFGYAGSVHTGGPVEQSPSVRVVTLLLYREDTEGKIEIPVDITRIERLDEPIVQTKDGTVYLTLSDKDMVEGKVLAVCNRAFFEIRDVLDLFLFHDSLGDDAGERIGKKIERMSLNCARALASVEKLADARRRHLAALDEILDSQVDLPVADRIREGGGAAMIFDQTVELLQKVVGQAAGGT